MKAGLTDALLCIDRAAFASKQDAKKAAGAIRNRLAEGRMSVSPEMLADMVSGEKGPGRAFCPAALTGTNEETWQSQRVVVADVDNDRHVGKETFKVDHPLTPDAAVEALTAAGIGYSFIYQSFSCSDDHPKFRVVLWLDETLTGEDGKRKAKEYGRKLNALLDAAAGEHVTDDCNQTLCQLFFPGRGILSAPYEIARCSVLDSLPDPKPEPATAPVATQQSEPETRNQSVSGPEITEMALREDLTAFILEHFPACKQERNRFSPCPVCGSESGFSVKGPFWTCHSTRHDFPAWMAEHVNADGTKQNQPGGTVIDLIRQKDGLTQAEALNTYRSMKGLAVEVVPDKQEAPAFDFDAIVADLRAAGYDFKAGGWTAGGRYADPAQVRKFVRDRFFKGKFPRGQTKEIMQGVVDDFLVIHSNDALKVVNGMDINASTQIEYIYAPIIPRGCLTSFQGDSGVGKSTILYMIAAATSIGADLGYGCPCKKAGAVLFITREDSKESIARSFLDAGGDARKLFVIDEDGVNINDPRIERTVKENGIVLVVIDPIQAFVQGDMNSATDMRRQTAPLAEMARAQDIGVIMVRHLSKQTGASFADRALGSSDVRANVRSALHVARDPRQAGQPGDADLLVFHIKVNDAKPADTLRFKIVSSPAGNEGFKAHAVLLGQERYTEADWRRDTRAAMMTGSDEALHPFVEIVRQIAKENDEAYVPNDWFRAKCAEMGRGSTEKVATLVERFGGVLFHDGIIVEPLTPRMFDKPFKFNGEEVKQEWKQRGFLVRHRKQDKPEQVTIVG